MKHKNFNRELPPRDPLEQQPMDLDQHADIVADLKRMAIEAHSLSAFPPHYSNVEDAMPGYNNGSFTTGWC